MTAMKMVAITNIVVKLTVRAASKKKALKKVFKIRTRNIYALGICTRRGLPDPPSPPSFSTQKNRCPSEYAHSSLRSLIYIHIYIYIYIYIYFKKKL